ncbi:MAG: Gfo/Idh/MocA family protein [Oscillospiraceae bacterium]
MGKEIRVGVVGVSRGMSFAVNAALSGMKLVALCDTWKEKLAEIDVGADVAKYTDYDEFLRHDMDAVVLANYFDEHAPFAIKALHTGKHVLSETTCNVSVAEGVALCEAVEETKLVYMLAENYCYTRFNQELRRIYRSGELGEVRYAEGEYNHPMAPEERLRISPGFGHWRNHLPPSCYNTHALAPLMYITECMPISVNGLNISAPEVGEGTACISDPGFVTLCRMDNGAVFRLFGLVMPGHSNWYRVHGTKGAAEITRGPGYFGPEQVRVWHEEWNRPDSPDIPLERTYLPDWPSNAEEAEKAGHGGGDFWVEHYFAEAIRTKAQPFLDVYRGVAMSTVGLLSRRSAMQDGGPVAVPDFRDKVARKACLKDTERAFSGVEAREAKAREVLDTASQQYAEQFWRENK